MMLRPLLSSFALLLAGCTGTGAGGIYPSLAKRPMESGGTASVEPAVSVHAMPVSDPALDADIARLDAQAQAGAAAFDRSYPDAERQAHAAANSGVSSEAWVAAQTALSALESARNDSVSALAGLDTLYSERVSAIADGKVHGGAEAIDAARRVVLAMVDAQNDRLDKLKALLPLS